MGKELIPVIRFRGFNEPWDELPFGKLVERVNETASDSSLPHVEYENILSGEGRIINEKALYGDSRTGIKFNKGDVLFGKLRPYLHNDLIASFLGVAVGDFWVLRSSQCIPGFLYSLINSPHYQYIANISSGSKMPRSDWSLVSSEKFAIPVKNEQDKIGQFFYDTAKTIEYKQKELEKLENMKKACMEKMFPREGETTPQLRFNGFSDPWREVRFSDIYQRSIIKNDLSFGTDKIISVANMYFVPKSYVKDLDYMRTYNVMKLGDIAFEGNRSKNFAHGRFVENTIGDGIVSHVFVVFTRIDSEYDLYFWKYLINYEPIMGPKLVNCTKSSTMMTDLVAEDFLKESILVPSLAEQEKIGNYFRHMDELIAAKRLEIEKLQNIKQSLLDKMFV